MAGISCILVFVLAFLVAYVVGQTTTAWRLGRLLRRRDGLITGNLAGRCALNLFVLPQIMLVLLAGIMLVLAEFMRPGDPLVLLTFSGSGAGISALCYFAAGVAMSYCLARPEHCLYRRPVSLVPLIVMALICLNYSAAVAVMSVEGLVHMTWTGHGWPGAAVALAGLVMFYIPAAPLVGLVLLMIHVGRILPRRRERQGDYLLGDQDQGEST